MTFELFRRAFGALRPVVGPLLRPLAEESRAMSCGKPATWSER